MNLFYFIFIINILFLYLLQCLQKNCLPLYLYSFYSLECHVWLTAGSWSSLFLNIDNQRISVAYIKFELTFKNVPIFNKKTVPFFGLNLHFNKSLQNDAIIANKQIFSWLLGSVVLSDEKLIYLGYFILVCFLSRWFKWIIKQFFYVIGSMYDFILIVIRQNERRKAYMTVFPVSTDSRSWCEICVWAFDKVHSNLNFPWCSVVLLLHLFFKERVLDTSYF